MRLRIHIDLYALVYLNVTAKENVVVCLINFCAGVSCISFVLPDCACFSSRCEYYLNVFLYSLSRPRVKMFIAV